MKFHVGTSIRSADEFYAVRTADELLSARLREGRSCFVVGPSQVGKSSLVARAQRELHEQFKWVELSLDSIGLAEPRQWFERLCTSLSKEAHVAPPPPGSASRVRGVLEVLRRIGARGRTIVWLDEINWVLHPRLDVAIRVEFLAALRQAHEQKARHEGGLANLTFVLGGFIGPEDLRYDPHEGPLTFADRIDMRDLSLDEVVDTFAAAFKKLPGDPAAWCRAIYRWTNGHPYFTQKLGRCVCEDWELQDPAELDERVKGALMTEWQTTDPVLRHVRDKLVSLVPPSDAGVLELYQSILDNPAGLTVAGIEDRCADARLTGLVELRAVDGELRVQVRNGLIRSIFDAAWCERMHAEIGDRLAGLAGRWRRANRPPALLLTREQYKLHAPAFEAGEFTTEEREFLAASHARYLRSVRFNAMLALAILAGFFAGAYWLHARTLRAEAETKRMEDLLAGKDGEMHAKKKQIDDLWGEIENEDWRVQSGYVACEVGEAAIFSRARSLQSLGLELYSSWVKKHDAEDHCRAEARQEREECRHDRKEVDGHLARCRENLEECGEVVAYLRGMLVERDKELAKEQDKNRACERGLKRDGLEQDRAKHVECEQTLQAAQDKSASCSKQLAECSIARERCTDELGTCPESREKCNDSLTACRGGST